MFQIIFFAAFLVFAARATSPSSQVLENARREFVRVLAPGAVAAVFAGIALQSGARVDAVLWVALIAGAIGTAASLFRSSRGPHDAN